MAIVITKKKKKKSSNNFFFCYNVTTYINIKRKAIWNKVVCLRHSLVIVTGI